jgi:hypothetical protein
VKQKEARATNGPRKAAERERREKRLLTALSTATPPYSRILRSWLAKKLDKPERYITPDDVQGVLAGKSRASNVARHR